MIANNFCFFVCCKMIWNCDNFLYHKSVYFFMYINMWLSSTWWNINVILACLFIISGVVSLVFYLCEKIKWYSVKMLFIKSFISCMFLFATIVALYKWGTSLLFWWFILAWQICSLVWDIWLDLKYLFHGEDSDISTYVWIVSFFVWQLLFSLGLLFTFWISFTNILIWIWVWAIGMVTCLIFEKIFNMNYWRFKLSAVIYSFILFCTIWISGALVFQNDFSNLCLNTMFVGSILFALSDMVLCWTYFAKWKETPLNFILNYAFYYSAQFLISLSVLFL